MGYGHYAFRAAGTDFAPYLDLPCTKAKCEAYTETGGGFPARFDARRIRLPKCASA